MKKLSLLLFVLCANAIAYVPTVESLFRHGVNPEVTANGVALTFVVKRLQPSVAKAEQSSDVSLVAELKQEDYYKLFFTRINRDVMKIAQTRYSNNSFGESSLIDREYFPSFTNYTLKANAEEAERGLFHAMLRSMIFNDGEFLVNYLKALGLPVKLNGEILNREKIELLAAYKRYLVALNKDRNARKTEINPLKPEDAVAREKAERIMSEPMYVDLKQVRLTRENDEPAWLISAGNLEAVVSYKGREIKRLKYKSNLGEVEFISKEHWLANGTHSLPRYILVRDYKGETFQVEILNLRHYLERESDLVGRLKKWDSLLKGKGSSEPKPAFVL